MTLKKYAKEALLTLFVLGTIIYVGGNFGVERSEAAQEVRIATYEDMVDHHMSDREPIKMVELSNATFFQEN